MCFPIAILPKVHFPLFPIYYSTYICEVMIRIEKETLCLQSVGDKKPTVTRIVVVCLYCTRLKYLFLVTKVLGQVEEAAVMVIPLEQELFVVLHVTLGLDVGRGSRMGLFWMLGDSPVIVDQSGGGGRRGGVHSRGRGRQWVVHIALARRGVVQGEGRIPSPR